MYSQITNKETVWLFGRDIKVGEKEQGNIALMSEQGVVTGVCLHLQFLLPFFLLLFVKF